MLKLNLYAQTMCWNTILRQARDRKIWMNKAAAALEAKSGEEVPDNKPVVEKKGKKAIGKKAVGVKKQKKPLVGKKAVVTKKPAAEKKPAEKKPTTEEKKAVA